MKNVKKNFIELYATFIGNNKSIEMVYYKYLNLEEATLCKNYLRDVFEDRVSTYGLEKLENLYKKIDGISSELEMEKIHVHPIIYRMDDISFYEDSETDFHLTADEKELSKKIKNYLPILMKSHTNTPYSEVEKVMESVIRQKDDIYELYYKVADIASCNYCIL